MDIDALLVRLERDGVLLLSDVALPSLTSLVTGGPIHRSWWGHPRGGEIYRLLNELAEHPDVLMIKLVAGKVTFVHRGLWPAVVAVGSAREAWQMRRLPESASLLLDMIEQTGLLSWDEVPPLVPPRQMKASEAIRQLEVRLLVHTVEVHTPGGAHARTLETWRHWASESHVSSVPRVPVAKRQLQHVLDQLNQRYGARGTLPWQSDALSARSHPAGRVSS
jgi:hypothetical protein